MDKKTRAALEASIKHWEENVAAKDIRDVSIYAEDCALCSKFLTGRYRNQCLGCPVRAKTLQPFCFRSPYGDAAIAYRDCINGASISRFRRAARKELAFLKSLRPKP